MSGSYTRGVSKWIKATPYVLIMLICLFAGLYILFKNKPSAFIPTEDEGRMFVTYEMPEATSTTRSIAMLRTIQGRLREIPAIKTVGGLAGFNVITFSNKSNLGTIFVALKPWDERKEKGQQIQGVIATIQKKMADLKEARVLAIAPPAIPGLGATAGFTFELKQTTSKDNVQQFEAVSRKFLGELYKRPEIGLAYTFFNTRTPGYQVNVDREKAK